MFNWLFKKKVKTGTEIVNGIVGKANEIKDQLATAETLIFEEEVENNETIEMLKASNDALLKKRLQANNIVAGLDKLFGLGI